ncbi:MAG TPA: hypothetical protein VFP34_14540 [Microlunatus sp.]|nr:hypothetical protein [Microlunatus sp.]
MSTDSTTRPTLPVPMLVSGMLGLAVLALVLATRAPLATTVLGLIAFGVLHNVLELRYVAGRFAPVLSGPFLYLLLALITGIVVCRLLTTFAPAVGRPSEIVLGFLVLAAGALLGLRSLGRARSRAGVVLIVAVALLLGSGAVASIAFPAYYFVVLTHLHNLVPLVFLWEWAGRIPGGAARAAFRLTQVLWIVVLPLVILAGALDRFIVDGPGVVQRFVGTGATVVASATPPTLDHWGLRFLVVFAFMQTMHYVVWVGFLPRFAPDATAAFEARVPWLPGRRAWVLGMGAGLVLAAVFVTDYLQGKAVYAALASYHAYLEFPVLLALLMAPGLLRPSVLRIASSPR